MNKKVLTLCAGLLLAGSATAWGQQVLDASSNYASPSNSKYQMWAITNTFNQFVIDNSSIVTKGEFPNVSPFSVATTHGAKPITELKKVDTDQAEDIYFQFVVSGSTTVGQGGTEVLTMVWVDKDANGNPISGHYELQVENVVNANFPENPIKLDRTLWKVTAYKDAAGTTLYYELQNKATDAILQLGTTPVGTANPNGFSEVALDIVAGQTDWRWAQGEKSTSATMPLNSSLTAQFSNGTTLYLAKKTVGNKVSLGAVIGNSNAGFTSNEIINGATFTPVTFEAWEANPILLNAAQINSELGNDLYDDNKSDGQFKFTFDPDVVGDTNIMTAYNFVAEDAKTANTRKPGDAPDFFVRFQNKANANQYLMVDTTYYNEEAQDRYELKMAVQEITFPRQAVVADDANSAADLDVTKIAELESKGDAYVGTYATAPLYSVAAYTQMKRQSNFLPIFYPSTSTLKLQAEMIYKKAKTDEPWWKQVTEDMTSGVMRIAEYAKDNTKNPLSGATATTPVNAVGYYLAYSDATTGTARNQKLSYDNLYQIPTVSNSQNNGYKVISKITSEKWSALPALATNIPTSGAGAADVEAVAGQMWIMDPTAYDRTSTNAAVSVFIPSDEFLRANSNVVKLVTLTSGHKVLSTDIADPNDVIYNGLLTNISLAGLRQNTDLTTTVDIPEGFYYIQNENKSNTLVSAYGDYRYEDLAATNAKEMYWNETRGTTGDWDIRDNANAVVGNLVYSEDKLVIPSAQWYIKGDGNHYKMYNRESGRQWGTEYWWATNDPQVFVNQATYTDAAGQLITYRDTIRLTAVPSAELRNAHLGYLWMEQDEAMADTTVYNVGITSLGDITLSLSVNEAGNLVMTPDSTGAYKLERVRKEFTDSYDGKKHAETELMYGYTTEAADTLVRAQYYIYKDEVSANSGIEPSSIKTRQYITLDGGKYKLSKVQVTFDNDLYTTEVDGENVRRAFYVKQITPAANQFVLVDPDVVNVATNNTGRDIKGARVFVNQLTAELQPGSLVSDGYANPYANSVLDLNKINKQNYADIRGGEDRMNAKFFVEGDNTWLLGENGAVKGSNVGLLELRKQDADICNSIFVDTANVHDAAFPRFLLAVRNVDSTEVSNIPNHNHHILTKGAYLVNMIDSAATNNVYKYVNRDFNNTEWYRLGFVNATHQGDSLTIDNTKTVFDLSTEGLDKTGGLNYATFAFRYVDTERDNFYIETAYKDATKGWVKIHNGVAVVTPDIQEAEVFSFETTDEYATANETIAAEGAVSVVATDGAVIVKGAEGKNVVIATILGKVVANETVNSDNETIAVPAGIAVVSVDGESFKVVVK